MAAGQYYTQGGGSSEYTCLPLDPEFNEKIDGTETGTFIYGAEYQTRGSIRPELNDQNVPCAVCYVPNRPAQVMIPAKRTCPSSWTRVRTFVRYKPLKSCFTLCYYQCIEFSVCF